MEEEKLEEKKGEEQKKEAEKEEMKWYIVHTYSGYEENVKNLLKQRIEKNKMGKYFGEIFIPSEEIVKEEKQGDKSKGKKRKFFPGYIFVQMVMNKDTWHLVRRVPYVTGFVGNQTQPQPVQDEDVLKLMKKIEKGELKVKASVEVGDKVRVIEGPFINFSGEVVSVNPERGRLTVKVSIFGRSTPVELDFSQVEKIS